MSRATRVHVCAQLQVHASICNIDPIEKQREGAYTTHFVPYFRALELLGALYMYMYRQHLLLGDNALYTSEHFVSEAIKEVELHTRTHAHDTHMHMHMHTCTHTHTHTHTLLQIAVGL